jgi:hypothetical protein
MSSFRASGERAYTRNEEVANTVSAATGLLVSLGVSPFLMLTALRSTQPRAVASAAVFLASVLALYLTSTLYHALAPGRAKRVVRLLDHSAIFVLIAGTYTPFALGPLAASGGRTLMIAVWTMAALGIVFKSRAAFSRRLSILLPVHGLVGNPLDSTLHRKRYMAGISLDSCRRRRLYRRHPLLRREGQNLYALRLASVRLRGIFVPHHRSVEVCHLKRPLKNPGRNILLPAG